MHFLAPSLLLGLIAAGLPWLLHRLGRRRANPVRFAAMELLLLAERQVSARRRLRDLLLLGVRTAAAAALPLLFARPYAEVRSDLPAAAQAPQSAVIVLDDSASMQRRAGGLGSATVFDEARRRARDLVATMSPETDVALVLASEGAPTPVAEPSTDRTRLLTALDGVSASARRGDLAAALTRATQIVRGGTHQRRRIYLFGDMQASGFPVDGPTAPPGVPVTVVSLSSDANAGGGAWNNRAVVDLTAEPAPEVGVQGIAVVAEVVNFSPNPVSHLGVTLLIDTVEVARGFVDLPAGGRVKKRFLHALAGGGAGHQAEVRIDPDRFPLDDRRQAQVEVSRGLRILIVDGDPRTVRNEDEVFFLEAALLAGGNRFQVQVVMPDDLVGRNL
ncbi:MAG: BatA and WFA domain-containing protein, partial [Haliangium ochraceum]